MLSVGTEGGGSASAQISAGDYDHLIGAIRQVVDRVVPFNATVLVISRGDDKLLELGARRALHFPQAEDGRYAGYHPADSDAAIALLENMRTRGADYLLLPSTAFWWLEYYNGFKQYIEHRYRVVEAGEHCWIAALTENGSGAADRGSMSQSPDSQVAEQLNDLLPSLLPGDARTALLFVAREDSITLERCETWFIPRIAEGDPTSLREQLERIADSDVRFLVLPKTLFAWLEDQPGLSEHLQESHRLVTRQANLCEIYELQKSPRPGGTEGIRIPTDLEERNGSARSLGQRLKRVIFRARRDDRRT